ncbi:A24 family peptidase [Streptomyces sp. N35]|uniref:prepilin peptidase n=1 Tax=Streptomyces sp. N35 TaxID=2795730 RepID=UPI0018F34BB0|nr:A24 family peptidase [Streptomyces sp. N35]
MPALLIALAALYGALAGTLTGRVAYRLSVPAGQPWRAVCPSGHALTGPWGGWLGTTRCETGRYGPSSAALVLLTAAVCAALAASTGARPELAVWLLLTPFGVVLATVDLNVHRLPDILTLPLAGAAAGGLGLAALFASAEGRWAGALLGGLALGGGYFALFLAHPSGMGFGDVKLAIVLGVTLGWYGWEILFLGFFAGIMYAGGYAAALVLLGRAGRKSAMPLGPCMLAGAATGVLLGGFGA